MFKRLTLTAILLLHTAPAFARDPIPVTGPARAGVEDSDLLEKTVLDIGVLAIDPRNPSSLRVGDGVTPGGVEVHATGCVTNFNGVCVATTNLDMKNWSIQWGPWQAHGDANEWDLGYGDDETFLRLVRDSGQAYLAYDFTIVDVSHYRFQLAWTGDGYDFPVLQVATNLVDGYASVDPADVTYSRPDTSHLVIDYTVPGEYVFLSFRIFAADRLSTGAYFGIPIYADYGLQAVGSLSVTGRVESYYDEHAEETRDRYVPGSITIDGEEVATTGAVAAVAADLAAHQSASNPHGITAAGIGALTVETDSAALSALGVASNALHDAIGTNAAAILAVSNRVDTLAATVSAIDADYLTSSDAAGFATTQAVASVERRVGVLETPPFACVWGNGMLSNTLTNWIPTNNWPSSHVELYVSDFYARPCTVSIRPGWEPHEDLCLDIIPVCSSTVSNRSFKLCIGSTQVRFLNNSSAYRDYQLRWSVANKRWLFVEKQLGGPPYAYSSSGKMDTYVSPNLSSNVFLPVFDEIME